jgi:hypothetical protein
MGKEKTKPTKVYKQNAPIHGLLKNGHLQSGNCRTLIDQFVVRNLNDITKWMLTYKQDLETKVKINPNNQMLLFEIIRRYFDIDFETWFLQDKIKNSKFKMYEWLNDERNHNKPIATCEDQIGSHVNDFNDLFKQWQNNYNDSHYIARYNKHVLETEVNKMVDERISYIFYVHNIKISRNLQYAMKSVIKGIKDEFQKALQTLKNDPASIIQNRTQIQNPIEPLMNELESFLLSQYTHILKEDQQRPEKDKVQQRGENMAKDAIQEMELDLKIQQQNAPERQRQFEKQQEEANKAFLAQKISEEKQNWQYFKSFLDQHISKEFHYHSELMPQIEAISQQYFANLENAIPIDSPFNSLKANQAFVEEYLKAASKHRIEYLHKIQHLLNVFFDHDLHQKWFPKFQGPEMEERTYIANEIMLDENQKGILNELLSKYFNGEVAWVKLNQEYIFHMSTFLIQNHVTNEGFMEEQKKIMKEFENKNNKQITVNETLKKNYERQKNQYLEQNKEILEKINRKKLEENGKKEQIQIPMVEGNRKRKNDENLPNPERLAKKPINNQNFEKENARKKNENEQEKHEKQKQEKQMQEKLEMQEKQMQMEMQRQMQMQMEVENEKEIEKQKQNKEKEIQTNEKKLKENLKQIKVFFDQIEHKDTIEDSMDKKRFIYNLQNFIRDKINERNTIVNQLKDQYFPNDLPTLEAELGNHQQKLLYTDLHQFFLAEFQKQIEQVLIKKTQKQDKINKSIIDLEVQYEKLNVNTDYKNQFNEDIKILKKQQDDYLENIKNNLQEKQKIISNLIPFLFNTNQTDENFQEELKNFKNFLEAQITTTNEEEKTLLVDLKKNKELFIEHYKKTLKDLQALVVTSSMRRRKEEEEVRKVREQLSNNEREKKNKINQAFRGKMIDHLNELHKQTREKEREQARERKLQEKIQKEKEEKEEKEEAETKKQKEKEKEKEEKQKQEEKEKERKKKEEEKEQKRNEKSLSVASEIETPTWNLIILIYRFFKQLFTSKNKSKKTKTKTKVPALPLVLPKNLLDAAAAVSASAKASDEAPAKAPVKASDQALANVPAKASAMMLAPAPGQEPKRRILKAKIFTERKGMKRELSKSSSIFNSKTQKKRKIADNVSPIVPHLDFAANEEGQKMEVDVPEFDAAPIPLKPRGPINQVEHLKEIRHKNKIDAVQPTKEELLKGLQNLAAPSLFIQPNNKENLKKENKQKFDLKFRAPEIKRPVIIPKPTTITQIKKIIWHPYQVLNVAMNIREGFYWTEIAGDGDCFFRCVCTANNYEEETHSYNEAKVKDCIAELRNILKININQRVFEDFKDLFGNGDEFDDYKWLKDFNINTVQKFKEFVLTKDFWAEGWSITLIENYFNIKFIIFNLQKNVIFETSQIFQPHYYIILSYENGNHYNLVAYKNKTILALSDLPPVLQEKYKININ